MVLCWKDHVLQEIKDFAVPQAIPQVVCFPLLRSILVSDDQQKFNFFYFAFLYH